MSESSLKRWCDRGLIPTVRTAGGHRRIPINGVLSFIKTRGFKLVDPEVLGLPAATGQGERTLGKAKESLLEAYVDAAPEAAIRIVLDLYLANRDLPDILDKVIQPALVEIGEKWSCGDIEIYEERRSIELTSRILFELRRLLARPGDSVPRAMGATIDGDPYTLAAKMAEITVRSIGLRTTLLGNELPFHSIYRAIENEAPDLFWLSISAIRDERSFIERMLELYDICESQNTRLAVGGVALVEPLRKELKYHSYCDTMAHLATFAASLMPSAQNREEKLAPLDDVFDDSQDP